MREIKVFIDTDNITVTAILKEGNKTITSSLTYPTDIYKMPDQIRSDPIMGMAELVNKDVVRIHRLFSN